MHRENYSRIIREWCAATGMQAWREDEDKHVEIEGVICGLIPGGTDEPDVMHVYIDLGPYDFPDLHQRLLERNVPLAPPDKGCFGLHPITGSVVYRTAFHLSTDSDGAQLPEKISTLIQLAREQMEISYIQ